MQPKSISRTLPRSTVASDGRPCGIAARGPARTIVSNASPSAPLARKKPSSSHATSRSVMPGPDPLDQVREAGSVSAQARPMASTSSAVLWMRSGTSSSSMACSSTPGAASASADQSACGTSGGLHAERRDLVAEEERRQVLVHLPGGLDELPAGRLDRRLLGVARVGKDEVGLPRDEQRAGPAGGRPLGVGQAEAAEVALVGRARDQDRVERALIEDRAQRR